MTSSMRPRRQTRCICRIPGTGWTPELRVLDHGEQRGMIPRVHLAVEVTVGLWIAGRVTWVGGVVLTVVRAGNASGALRE